MLVTLKADGGPQLSNVAYAVIAGEVRVSVSDGRAKTANLRGGPRVSLHVTCDDFWTYLAVEGDATVSPVAARAGTAPASACSSCTTPWQPHPTPTARSLPRDGR